MPIRAVFVDRDGVINEKAPEGDYVKCWQEFKFLPRAQEAIQALKQHDFTPIVVSNQRGIALGRMTDADLAEIHCRMLAELEKVGARIPPIYYCPHDLGACQCRKPELGMFLHAQRDLPGLDFSQAFVVGDSVAEMQSAERLGSRKVLISGPRSSEPVLLAAQHIEADYVAGSLWEATTNYILAGGLLKGARLGRNR